MTEYTKEQRELIDRHRNTNVNHEWWDYTFEYIYGMLDSVGISMRDRYERQSNGKSRQNKFGTITFDLYRRDFSYDSYTCSVESLARNYQTALGIGCEKPETPPDYSLSEDSECPLQVSLRTYLHDISVKLDLLRLMQPPEELMDELTFSVKRGELEYDAHLSSFEDSHPTQYKLADEILDVLKEMCKDICHACYKILDEEHDYLTSDDAVWETIEANGLHEVEDDEAA